MVAVAFGDGLEINLLGLARMALPRPGAALVSIELALLARFSTREGVFMIKAQLTDNSWLLYEDIRLTGGFAFALWWKGPLAGQFVVTMGGYHPDFHRDGYPDVPRLGLVWQISNAIVIKGESYFALTSEALMAGTRVEVSVDFGWVWARIEFGADGIVYFDPFFFDVRAYCRISAGIDIDLGLFSISLSLTLGASIHVWGPEFAGEVRFEIGPCEVPISFGPQQQQPGPTLDWPAFVTKYLEDAGSSRARALSGITGRGTLPTSTGGSQGAPSADGSAALPFRVFAEFEVSFTSTIPALTIAVGAATKPMPPVLSNGAPVAMGLAPMGAGALTSQLSVALRQRIGSTWQPEARLAKLAANLTAARAARRRVPDHDRCVPDRRVGSAEGAGVGQSGVAVGRRGDHRQPGDPGGGDRCADRRPADRLLPGHVRGQAAPAERDRERSQQIPADGGQSGHGQRSQHRGRRCRSPATRCSPLPSRRPTRSGGRPTPTTGWRHPVSAILPTGSPAATGTTACAPC